MRARTGSIGQDGRVRITVNGERRTLGTYADRDEAERRLEAALGILDDEDIGDDVTVSDWCEKWLTRREIGKAVEDPESEWSRWRTHVKPDPIGAIGLRALRRGDVNGFVARVQRKVAAQTTRNVLGVLRGALAAALDEGRVRANVATAIKVRADKRTEDPWTYLTPDEQAALIAAVPGPERHLVAFAIASGLRAGELCALRLVDTSKDRIVVRYGRPGGKATKTGRVRTVSLVVPARTALAAWLEALPSFAPKNPLGLVFPRKHGGHRDPAHVIPWHVLHGEDGEDGALARAGITRRVRWHDFRHTCASSLVCGWWGRTWSIQEVRGILGHTSIKTTERYAHLADSTLQDAADQTLGSGVPLKSAPVAYTTPAGGPEEAGTSQTDANRTKTSQAGEIVQNGAAFLNRWSQVRFSPGAPREKGSISDRAEAGSGQLAADSLALLRAVVRGDSDEAHRLASVLRGDTMTRAIELAEAVLVAQQSEVARAG